MGAECDGQLAKKKLEETTKLRRFIRPPGKQIQAYLKICEYICKTVAACEETKTCLSPKLYVVCA